MTKIYTTSLTALTLSAITTAGAASAATLQVDINRSQDIINQSGWVAWDIDGNSFDALPNIKVTPYADAVAGSLQLNLITGDGANGGTRQYGIASVSDPSNLDVPDVWKDHFFFGNTIGGSMTLGLGNLLAGDYEITTYHYSHALSDASGPNDAGIADIFLNGVDTGQNAELITGNGASNTLTAAEVQASKVTTAFTVATDGGGATILFDNLNSNGGGDSFGINGFELTLVPEPSSLALLGLGGLLIARRRRA